MLFANTSDVLSCYRIFLGREPDPDGFRGFVNMISGGGFPLFYLAEMFNASTEAVQLRASRNSYEVVEAQFPGFSMYAVPAWNNINRSIAGGEYEPHISDIFRTYIKPGMSVIDIGANIGYFSMLAASLGAIAHAFEPNMRNVWLLNKNRLHSSGEIKIYPHGLGRDDSLVLYTPMMGNGQIGTISDSVPIEGQEIIRLVTLDSVMAEHAVDFIKIDVEGAEGLVLQGASRTLDKKPIVVSEFVPESLAKISGLSARDYLDLFTSRGYSLKACMMSGEVKPVSADGLLDVALSQPEDLMDFLALPD